jgi:subtilisin family serine protease
MTQKDGKIDPDDAAEVEGRGGNAGAQDVSPDAQADEPSWIPGIVEIQLRGGTQPEVAPALDGGTCAFSSGAESFQFSELNDTLQRYGCRNAVPVFDTTHEETVEAEAETFDEDIDVPDLRGFYTLHFPEGADVLSIANELQKLTGVERAVPVPKTRPACVHVMALPNDTLLGAGDQAEDKQWYIFRCRVECAWAMGFTGKGVVIADIDWGFLIEHPDLSPRLNLSRAFNSADGSPNVSQGDDIHHGTGVLGLAGAAANGDGIVGVAYGAELWPIQVNDTPSSDFIDPQSWARAIRHVSRAHSGDMRKVIILEGETFKGRNITQVPSISAAVLHAIARRAVVCVPAGNGRHQVELDDQNQPFDPVGILVGATTFSDQPYEDCNFGDAVVVCAPGDPKSDLTCSDNLNDPYRLNFGATSGATAKVAGAVALMLEANPRLRHADVAEILSTTGVPIISEAEEELPLKKFGRFLNCEEAVLAAKNFS